jgi:hypothetical protein
MTVMVAQLPQQLLQLLLLLLLLLCQLPLMSAVICFLLTLAGNPADVSACNA